MTKQQLTTSEAAAFLGISRPQIIRQLHKGNLTGTLHTTPAGQKYWLVDVESLEHYKNTPRPKGGRPKKVE